MADIPIYRRPQIEALAVEFVNEHRRRSTKIPLPIESMVESLGIEIYPVPRFCDPQGGRTAALSNDVQSITIDERLPHGHYRFALAHECGHYVLHRDFISESVIKGKPEEVIISWRQLLSRDNPRT